MRRRPIPWLGRHHRIATATPRCGRGRGPGLRAGQAAGRIVGDRGPGIADNDAVRHAAECRLEGLSGSAGKRSGSGVLGCGEILSNYVKFPPRQVDVKAAKLAS